MKKSIFLIFCLVLLLSAGYYANLADPEELFIYIKPEKNQEKPKESPKDENPPEVLPEIVWGNRNKKQVIFTFDAGSGIQSLDRILSVLEKYELKGTFFITGKWAEQNPESLRRISSAGHEIFNHTYSHPYLTRTEDEKIIEELNMADEIIYQITGVSTKPYFRPPYGDRDARVFEKAFFAGYRAVYWTIDVLDWKEDQGFTKEQSKARIMDNLKPGTIYLMHIGDDITGDILDEVFSEIISQGYSIVSLSEGVE
ncbi:MAG: hypothetical protein A2562_02230 [Candidatus Nealsonbacteria bacterium RIFOXYD1_FULL_39_11]|nr:MAG: hypothetical protein A2562_02230 [Candidatus Nealsonbacteria bacterium RIFOXYD1_FULL_39_11]